MEDKCPFCGADKLVKQPPCDSDWAVVYYPNEDDPKYECFSDDIEPSYECLKNQIADLQRRLELWRKVHRRTSILLEDLFMTFCPDDWEALKFAGEVE